MERAIYAIVAEHHHRSGTTEDAAWPGNEHARCAQHPGYHRRLELRTGGWAIRADCYLYATAEAAMAALATFEPREERRAVAALLLSEGSCPGVDDVVLLCEGRRARFALAMPAMPLW